MNLSRVLGLALLIKSAILDLFIRELKALTFSVNIERYVVIPGILLFFAVFFFSNPIC
jgi:hypothetical protein